jgi:ATP-binding cassette subfamily B protein
LLIDWQAAIIAAVVFGSAYLAIAMTASHELRLNGGKLADADKIQLKILQEGIGGLRDVILRGNQMYYEEMYSITEQKRSILQARNGFLALFPRYIIEAGGLICLSVIGMFLMLQHGNKGDLIPILGTIALGAQRLLPSLQQIYGGWATIKSSNAAIACIVDILNEPVTSGNSAKVKTRLSDKIKMEKVCFRYKVEGEEVLKYVDWEIHQGERIGLIGSSGAGKSTVIDILVGLLKPTYGRVIIDGLDLHDVNNPKRLQSWRSAIAYVPQSVYLADRSVAENIAFGERIECIDYDMVKEAAKGAQIEGFLDSMPDGYATFVGERGIRLSGGQRQRIGIARALYQQSQIIIFDEATSALDTETESRILSVINNISRDVTIIMIAHRPSTLNSCDKIFRIEGGKISLES